MTIEQTVTIKGRSDSLSSPLGIDEVRQLLQKEMTEKGTLGLITESGSGWEAHVRERYAES